MTGYPCGCITLPPSTCGCTPGKIPASVRIDLYDVIDLDCSCTILNGSYTLYPSTTETCIYAWEGDITLTGGSTLCVTKTFRMEAGIVNSPSILRWEVTFTDSTSWGLGVLNWGWLFPNNYPSTSFDCAFPALGRRLDYSTGYSGCFWLPLQAPRIDLYPST